jgi:hypothetical protein
MSKTDFVTATPLCKIMGLHGSDKGNENITNSWHNYTTVYYQLFQNLQNMPIRLFEMGIGTNFTDIPSNMGSDGKPGASLKGWEEFFPNAQIFGADIDRRILFESGRIKTAYCDQLNPEEIKNIFTNWGGQFDIMIDDGLHEFAANVSLFENSIPFLANNGFYIIEDIHNNYIPDFESKLDVWRQAYPNLEFDLARIPSDRNSIDNNLLIVRKWGSV